MHCSLKPEVIEKTTGFIPSDVMALNAVLSVSPLPATLIKNDSRHFVVDFKRLCADSTGGSAALVNLPLLKKFEQKDFADANSTDAMYGNDLRVFIPNIPLDIKIREPGLYSDEELKDSNNRIPFLIGKAEQKVRALRQSWSDFFISFPKPSKQELDNYSKKMRDRFLES